jgi:HlyD family secretion protein
MRKWWFRSLVLVGLVAVVLWFTLWRGEAVPVRVATVERANVESTITNSKAGTVRARRRARLSAEVGGRVVEILKRDGARAKRGEILVRLNDASARAQLKLAQESLRVAEAARRQACIARDRALRELERSFPRTCSMRSRVPTRRQPPPVLRSLPSATRPRRPSRRPRPNSRNS